MKKFAYVLVVVSLVSMAVTLSAYGSDCACEGSICSQTTDGSLRFDFETGCMQGWQIMEGTLDSPVTSIEMTRNQPSQKRNKQGIFYLNTVELQDGGYDDKMTGVIESPVFTLKSRQVSFLIGGGSFPASTYVALCDINGDELLKATGSNSEMMTGIVWDTSRYLNKKLFLQLVDRNTGSWGHITFDDFIADGKVDLKATLAVRKSYDTREQGREQRRQAQLKKWEDQRMKRIKKLTSPDYLVMGGKTKVYKGAELEAISIPIGGIGAGNIQMDGKAQRAIWQIFNNFKCVSLPNSFFAVRAEAEPGQPVVRVLQTAAAAGFAPMRSLTFKGEFPYGWYDFRDSKLPVSVSMEVFNPLIPLNAKDSAIPCAIFNITAKNKGPKTVDVSLMATQRNAVGYTAAKAFSMSGLAVEPGAVTGEELGGNRNQIIKSPDSSILHMTADIPQEAAGYGDMALLAVSPDAIGSTDFGDVNEMHKQYSENGLITGSDHAGPSAKGKTLDGFLAVPFKLKPGESRTISFVLTWYFPNASHGTENWSGSGNMYQNWYSSALDVAQDVKTRLTELSQQTDIYHDSFYSSNLPRWILDRISSQVSIMRTQTCFWAKDGYFGGWEGSGTGEGCCEGNCTHVWHYAQSHARLFPEIGRRMREQEYAVQNEDGSIGHRLSKGFAKWVAADGLLGDILSTYREHQLSADNKWLDQYWPNCRKAMEYCIKTWDADEDGVLTGYQWDTLDSALEGNTTWIGSLYLASLAACERMANVENSATDAQRYARILQSGKDKQNAELWDGEYYIQKPDVEPPAYTYPEPREDYLTGCDTDQLLGQWWAHQLDLGWLYPSERVRKSMQSLMKYNFHADFRGYEQKPRKFVDELDSGLQLISYPKEGRPAPGKEFHSSSEIMSGFEYPAAATMIQAGLLKEGFALTRAIYERYDGKLRTGQSALDIGNWGYTGNPFGDDECGKFYARAMSVWSILLACQGFIYDGPAGKIGFRPVWQPTNHMSFFTAAEGYGFFVQNRSQYGQSDAISISSGLLSINTIVLEYKSNRPSFKVTVSVDGKEVPSSFKVVDGVFTISLDKRLVLTAEQIAMILIR